MGEKSIGVLMSINLAAHGWVGMNYVITDYVKKISKSLIGPARVLSAGMSAVTLVGLSSVALFSTVESKELQRLCGHERRRSRCEFQVEIYIESRETLFKYFNIYYN